eukprot:CAMPEP_0184331810 /NCGR_PEP_ID=MMETSP1089-20130417/1096_1 /TAXON_ID=38269 ORGANISM="Gloeochaete wittrockiana, Strain SAG46.84" /NCGR_SAMPLE_ID=MMETSP1089 /ASSEMBLY_ACC=CAM_ASM_000445 /LENGTH=105 /DNA_ID=CAMNT_0026654919 /DNA_START=20 /DNA_END=334 /DNA_ORIENTATION=+
MTEVGETRDLDMVKLISADGHTFFVDTKAAMVSGTIKSMLSGPGNFTEQREKEITFREISTPILEKVIQYFYFKQKYMNSTAEAPEFPIDTDIALELLLAANYLD